MSITYGAKTVITMGIDSVANDAAWQSLFVDNASDLFDDALVRIRVTGQASSAFETQWYVYADHGDGNYTDGASGADATFTTSDRRNSKFLASVQMNATVQAEAGLFSVAALFGGTLPKRWGLIMVNRSGDTLSVTAGEHVIEYMGVTY